MIFRISLFSILLLAYPSIVSAQTSEVLGFSDVPDTYDSDILPTGNATYYKSTSDANQYYLQPEIYIDIKKAQDRFSTKCQDITGADKNKRYAYRIDYHMYPGKMFQEARSKIIKNEQNAGRSPNANIRVSGYPFKKIIFTYGASEDSPYEVKQQNNGILTGTLKNRHAQKVSLTCEQAFNVFGDGILDIDVDLVVDTRSYNEYTVEAQLSYFFREVLDYDIDRSEKQYGGIRYVTKSSGKSGGLLGAILGGRTSAQSAAGTVDNRRRFVSVDAFNDSFQNFERKFDLRVVRDGAVPDSTSVNEIKKLLKGEATNGLKKETISFNKGAKCGLADTNSRCLLLDGIKKPIPKGTWIELVNSISSAAASSGAALDKSCPDQKKAVEKGETDAAKAAAAAATKGAKAGSPGGAAAIAAVAEDEACLAIQAFAAQMAVSGLKFSAVGNTEEKWVPTSFDAYAISSDYFSADSGATFKDRTYLPTKTESRRSILVNGTLDEFNVNISPNSKLEPYVLSLKLGHGGHKSIPVDMNEIERYCSDKGGCLVTLSMNTWKLAIPDGNKASFGPVNFFYNPNTKAWRIAQAVANSKYYHIGGPSTLNDKNGKHVMRAAGCFFTENYYNISDKKLDTDDTFYLHAPGSSYDASYPYDGKVCDLIIRD